MSYDTDFDSQKLMYHPAEAAEWLRTGRTRGPLYTEMELCRQCNCRCLFCGVDYEVNATDDQIDATLARRVITELQELGNKSVMFSGSGEPLLHPEADEIIAHCAARMSTSVTTNGTALTPERGGLMDRLKWLRFSVNAGTPENYALVHGVRSGLFEQAMANLAGAVARKRERRLDVTIGVQLVLINENAGTAFELARRVKETGVDYFSVKPYSQHPSSRNRLEVDYSAFADLRREIESLQDATFKVIYRARSIEKLRRPKPYAQCFGTHFIALISANGNVWECNVFVADPRFLIGNLREQSLSAIWNGPRRKEVLAFFEKQLDLRECRDVCRMDECNRYLWRLKHPWEHDDFI